MRYTLLRVAQFAFFSHQAIMSAQATSTSGVVLSKVTFTARHRLLSHCIGYSDATTYVCDGVGGSSLNCPRVPNLEYADDVGLLNKTAADSLNRLWYWRMVVQLMRA